jgi:hypothetical protein
VLQDRTQPVDVATAACAALSAAPANEDNESHNNDTALHGPAAMFAGSLAQLL